MTEMQSVKIAEGNDTVAGIASVQTLTNKTINLSNNTLSFTSAQLATACSDETGSGALVFANGPTLGTVSATSLNATGVVTASQLVSTVSTGTAPLVVSSTTLVSNLNAQYLNGNDSTYYTNASNLSSGTI
jgi:hypothetical protein